MRKEIMHCVKGITRNSNLLIARNPVLGLTIYHWNSPSVHNTSLWWSKKAKCFGFVRQPSSGFVFQYGYGAENALQDGGQVSTRRHVWSWCPFFRLGFGFLPHFPTTPRTSAPLLHHPFTAFLPSTLHHIHIPLTPQTHSINSSVTDDIFVAAILAAICRAFSVLAPFFKIETPKSSFASSIMSFLWYLVHL